MDPKTYLTELFRESLAALSPENVVRENVRRTEGGLQLAGQSIDTRDRPLYLLAVGKAAVPMTAGFMKEAGEQVSDLLVITPRSVDIPAEFTDKITYGSHPVPDEQSLDAGQRAAEFFKNIPPGGIAVTLLSGGTSSLMCLPVGGISIGDLNRTFRLLNRSGATIREINAVRKHCSQIKGGQLLRFPDPSVTLVDLVISDVPDDDLSVIGSGPTTPDNSTFRSAHRALLKYELWNRVPDPVRLHIESRLDGESSHTLKDGEDPLEDHYSRVISSSRKLAQKAVELAEEDGYVSRIDDGAFNADVEEMAAKIAEKAMAVSGGEAGPEERSPPAVLVFYGESTVNVIGDGQGGRNQELALRGALHIAGRENITWLSAGTDGVDGPTDAAGAVVDGSTVFRAGERELDPATYLRNNDTYNFHRQMDTLLKTGPTGNNLMDIVLVFVDEKGQQ